MKAVFITAPNEFRDEEYYKPKQILEEGGVTVITASTKIGDLVGRFGFRAKSSLLIERINPDDFDAIVYVGGAGASVFFDNLFTLKLAKIFFETDKIVASICIAGVILANSGILKGKKATVFREGEELLVKGGAIYSGVCLEIDGNIVTANGPESAESFGKAILKAIKDRYASKLV